jgi:hypothetical protein
MGAILFISKNLNLVNPLTLTNDYSDYVYKVEVEMSSEMIMMLCNKFRVMFNIEPSEIDVKV